MTYVGEVLGQEVVKLSGVLDSSGSSTNDNE